MRRTPCASADPVHVLVAFGRVLSEVDAGAKHASDVGVTLVEAFVDDGVDEGRACHEGAGKQRRASVRRLHVQTAQFGITDHSRRKDREEAQIYTDCLNEYHSGKQMIDETLCQT